MAKGEKYCPVAALKRLLLATDGSLHSEGAVREAIRLAKLCSSTLHVMSVMDVFDNEIIIEPAEDMREAKVGKILKSIKVAALKEGIECDTTIAYGDPADEILDEAKRSLAD